MYKKQVNLNNNKIYELNNKQHDDVICNRPTVIQGYQNTKPKVKISAVSQNTNLKVTTIISISHSSEHSVFLILMSSLS